MRGLPLLSGQAAIEFQDVGDVLRDIVAGAVTEDDEVLRLGFALVLHGGRSG